MIFVLKNVVILKHLEYISVYRIYGVFMSKSQYFDVVDRQYV